MGELTIKNPADTTGTKQLYWHNDFASTVRNNHSLVQPLLDMYSMPGFQKLRLRSRDRHFYGEPTAR